MSAMAATKTRKRFLISNASRPTSPKKKNCERGWRFSLTAQYDQLDDYLFSLPADMVEPSLPAHNTWKAKLGVGRTFQRSLMFNFWEAVPTTGTSWEKAGRRGWT